MTVWKSSEAKESGFKGIKKVEGDVVEVNKVEQFVEGRKRSALEFKLANAKVLQSDTPQQLADDEFSFQVGTSEYADSFWMKYFIPAYEKLGVDLSDGTDDTPPVAFYQRTVFERIEGKSSRIKGGQPSWTASNFIPVEVKGIVEEEPEEPKAAIMSKVVKITNPKLAKK